MSKRQYRFFYGFLDAQERFLNKMAAEGWRLMKTGRITYVFERCAPGAYRYGVDFIAAKSPAQAKDYRCFLESTGLRTMTKPSGVNFAFGKIRLRPWGRGWGMLATSPGTFNKELLIVEKRDDGRPFSLHTTAEDRIAYYRTLGAAWGTVSLALAAFAVHAGVRGEAWWRVLGLGILCVGHLWAFVRSRNVLSRLRAEAEVTES